MPNLTVIKKGPGSGYTKADSTIAIAKVIKDSTARTVHPYIQAKTKSWPVGTDIEKKDGMGPLEGGKYKVSPKDIVAGEVSRMSAGGPITMKNSLEKELRRAYLERTHAERVAKMKKKDAK